MTTVRRIFKVSLITLGLAAFLGFTIGVGWAEWGDIKGERFAAVLIGLIGGLALGLPIVAFLALDSLRTAWWKKAALSLLPLLVLSFCIPFYGGLVMFLQLLAILVPSFAVKKTWVTLLASLTGGFGFLGIWFLLYFRHLAPISSSDNIFAFYPFAIILISIDVTIARAINRIYVKQQLTTPSA